MAKSLVSDNNSNSANEVLVSPGVHSTAVLGSGAMLGHHNWPSHGVKEIHSNDIVFGRGSRGNKHSGNVRFREFVNQRKVAYINSTREQKTSMALQINREWSELNPPGRFLKQDAATGLWNAVDEQQARKKTSQLLREDAPTLRKQLEENGTASVGSPSPKSSSPSLKPSLPPSQPLQNCSIGEPAKNDGLPPEGPPVPPPANQRSSIHQEPQSASWEGNEGDILMGFFPNESHEFKTDETLSLSSATFATEESSSNSSVRNYKQTRLSDFFSAKATNNAKSANLKKQTSSLSSASNSNILEPLPLNYDDEITLDLLEGCFEIQERRKTWTTEKSQAQPLLEEVLLDDSPESRRHTWTADHSTIDFLSTTFVDEEIFEPISKPRVKRNHRSFRSDIAVQQEREPRRRTWSPDESTAEALAHLLHEHDMMEGVHDSSAEQENKRRKTWSSKLSTSQARSLQFLEDEVEPMEEQGRRDLNGRERRRTWTPDSSTAEALSLELIEHLREDTELSRNSQMDTATLPAVPENEGPTRGGTMSSVEFVHFPGEDMTINDLLMDFTDEPVDAVHQTPSPSTSHEIRSDFMNMPASEM